MSGTGHSRAPCRPKLKVPPVAANPSGPVENALSRCNSLVGQTLEGATVTRAQLLAASGKVPERCTVLAEMRQDLRFEVNLPTTWNDRTVFMGGGGFDGSIYCAFITATPGSPIRRAQRCPAELKCTAAETDACLTDAQIETARLFVAPTTGRYPWAGFPFGAKGQQGTTAYVFGGPVVQFLLARLAQVWRSGLWTSATPWGARRRYDRGIARG